ncbi:MAG TPA: HEAT repeat domain-containing protein [Myxococcota bacterium]|nr:HEAT repeat domain-containing protein [Myxococcota bacterium]
MRRAIAVFFAAFICISGAACSNTPEIDGKKVGDWIALFRHEDWAVQTQAEEAVARLGEPALPYLLRNLPAPDPALRLGAVATLGKMGAPALKMVPELLKRMKVEKVAVIRTEILKALANIDPRAEGVLQEFKKRLRDEDADVREAARAGLSKLKPPKPAPKKDVPGLEVGRKVSFELRAAVGEQLAAGGLAFGMIAEVVREDKRAAIVWPAVKGGKIVDDDIVAFVFEKKDEKWKLSQGNLKMSVEDGPAKLTAALGGADKQRVVRPCGVAEGELADFLGEHGKQFKEALAAGKDGDAVRIYEELTWAFSFRLAAYDDALPEMLTKGAFGGPGWKLEISKDKKSATVSVQLGGKAQTGTVQLGKCGGGTIISGFPPNPK